MTTALSLLYPGDAKSLVLLARISCIFRACSSATQGRNHPYSILARCLNTHHGLRIAQRTVSLLCWLILGEVKPWRLIISFTPSAPSLTFRSSE